MSECAFGSGLLSDPSDTVIVVDYRDGLSRFWVEHVHAAQGPRIAIVDRGGTADDFVRDVNEMLTSMCARLNARRGARERALRAVTAAIYQPDMVEAR